MFKRTAWCGVLIVAILGLSSSALALKIAFPSYIYPGPEYDTIISNGSVQIVMFNPNSGPGTSVDPGYTAQLIKNKAAGKQTYGYLGTGYFCAPTAATDPTASSPYANRCNPATIQAGIDTWQRFYPGLDGIFFDEADTGKYAGSSDTLGKWQDVIAYTSSKGMKSIVNFGSDGFATDLSSLNAIMVSYEGNAQTYLNTNFTNKGPNFYHIIYDVSPDLVTQVAAKAASTVGYAFLTNYPQQDGAYSKLPLIWDQVGQAIGSTIGSGIGRALTPTTPGATNPPSSLAPDERGKPAAQSTFVGNVAGSCDTSSKTCNSIEQDIQLFINVLAIGVGVIVTAMIIFGGIQYMTSRDNPQSVQAAKTRISNALIALISFIFLYAFLQWITPGGIF